MALYKYIEPARIDVIQNKQIRFTPSSEFNDPFDLKPYITKMAEDSELDQCVVAEHEVFFKKEYGKLASKHKQRISENMFSFRTVRTVRNAE